MSKARLYRKPTPGYVTVELDLEPELVDILEAMALEKGMTVDKVVEQILEQYIKQLENNREPLGDLV